MTYVPHTDDERREMLDAIGVRTMEELFADVPERVRFPRLNLPPPSTELEIEREMHALADRNIDCARYDCFLGAGSYHHYRPPTVDAVLRRGEFYTAYTPYQPELSQGMLQAMFEYQSMICRLTAMEVSNASHYDGATSLAEAALLALNTARRGRRKVIVTPTVHPHYRRVLRTYLQRSGAKVTGDDLPHAEVEDLTSQLDAETAAFVIQNPNFFGQFEDVAELAGAVHAAGALLIVVADPISLGLFQPPGEYGADIVVADGQALGLPPSFGGPQLGIMAVKKANVRKLAGRLVGATVDVENRRGYVLTLGTREQHIRRAHATSNICTNAGLSALGAAVFLAVLGKAGLERLARLCYHKSHYAASRIAEIPGVAVNPQAPDKPFFKEFVISLPKSTEEVNRRLLDDWRIIGGYDLGRDYPQLTQHMLLAVTEMNSRSAIDRLVEGIRRATAQGSGRPPRRSRERVHV